MNTLPRIVIDRLRQATGRNSPRRASADRAGTRGVIELRSHPDANLISAFVERTLTDNEQARIMDHLAECPSCRELVRLTSPRIDFGVHNGQYFRPEHKAFPVPALHDWRGFRWGALAAVAMIVISVAARHRSAKQANVTVAQNAAEIQQSFSPGETISSRLALPEAPPAGTSDAPSSHQKKRESAASPGARSISRGGPARVDKLSTIAAEATAKNQSRLRSGSRETVVLPLKSPAAPTFTAGRTGSHDRVANKPHRAETALDSGQPDSGSEPQTAKLSLRAKLQASKQGAPSAVLSAVAKAKVARSETRPESNLRWSISSLSVGPVKGSDRLASGRVKRSTDGGRTWETIHLDDSVSFRVVHAAGATVWAGGSDAALYHSTDAGHQWTRVRLASPSVNVSGTVREIDFSDAQHGRIKTDAGETWTTSDGGQDWEKIK